jgi:DNA-binding LacI/PurR family transcriptional regulator
MKRRRQSLGAPTRCETVTGKLRNLILDGHYAPDEKIPPERELAITFGVNRMTVSKALATLADDGLLVRKVGSGTYVSGRKRGRGKLTVVNVALPLSRQGDSDAGNLLGEPGVAEAAYEFFRDRGVKVAVSFFRDHRDLAGLLPRFAREQNAAHIIWYSLGEGTADGLRLLQRAGHLFCLIDAYEPGLESNFVGTDNEAGGRMAARELLQAGHRKLLYVTLPLRQTSLLARSHGFQKEAAAGEASVTALAWEAGQNMTALVTEHLRTGGASAIATSNDELALALAETLPGMGFPIPETVSLIGFDGLAATQYTRPPLTTLRQAFYRIGFLAAELIERQWSSPSAQTERQLVPPVLVSRNSLAPRYS